MTRPVSVEALETRRLLSASLTSKGTLVVEGTAAADAISVRRSGGSIVVLTAEQDGSAAAEPVLRFKAAKVKRVLVEAGDGSDLVDVTLSTVPTTVAGGTGNDVLTGRAGCTLVGGGGNDYLASVPAGTFAVGDGPFGNGAFFLNRIDPPAVLSGGAGNDVLVSNTQGDIVVGGTGVDQVFASLASGERRTGTQLKVLEALLSKNGGTLGAITGVELARLHA